MANFAQSIQALQHNVTLPVPALTDDAQRIIDLPRRHWSEADLMELTQLVTESVRKRGSSASLRPLQALAIAEACDAAGLFGAIAVGAGKTLISFVAPLFLEAKRPLLIQPAKLIPKTEHDLRTWDRHFRLHPNMQIVSYEKIRHPNNRGLLQLIDPDLIVADECHKIKNAKAVGTLTLLEYFKNNDHVKLLALSGSMMKKSVMDYWHIMQYAMRHSSSPLPTRKMEAQRWADALDPDTVAGARPAPGVLLALSDPAADTKGPSMTSLDHARDRYNKRLSSTQGVIIAPGERIEASLTINRRGLSVPSVVAEALSQLRKTYRTPNDDLLKYALEVWACARQLMLGFFYRWDPPPPREWLTIRTAFNGWVREGLAAHRRYKNSVATWCAHHKDARELVAWQEIRNEYIPDDNRTIEWVSDFAVQDAAAWVSDTRDGPGIVWTEHVVFARKVSAVSGAPYLGAGKKAAEEIQHVTRPFVTSQQARSEGENLQTRYARNLLTAVTPDAGLAEQLIGRTHRSGQPRDEAAFDLYLHCEEAEKSLTTAINRAHANFQDQKLSYADYTFDLDALSEGWQDVHEEKTDWMKGGPQKSLGAN